MSKRVFVAGLALTSTLAFGQNWVSSGTPGSPVIPFDALTTGWTNPSPTGASKGPLYTCRGGTAEGFGLQVGKFTPGNTGCEFGYGGTEISVPDFEFLATSWESASSGFVPPNAVVGGQEPASPGSTDRLPLYYCRGKLGGQSLQRPANFPSSLQLGRIRPGYNGCIVPYSGTEITVAQYEILVALNPPMPLAIVPEINGFVPQDAIRAGTDADGTPLYICSALFNGAALPGKLHSSFGGCNISYAGVEHTISSYNVLRPDWLGIPNYDFAAGVDVDGSPLHICRAFLNSGLYPGKKRQPWTTCNIGLSGHEETSTVFEILSH
jgi:Protein of unknown function (DUF3421)